VVSSGTPAGADESFRLDANPGPYAVGLRVVEQYDYSRGYRSAFGELGKPYMGERARPLQTVIWYPATKEGGATLTVRDYLHLWATETSFGDPRIAPEAKNWIAALTPALDTHVWAVRDAKSASGRFPVVIYAPGASDMAWENADLCEYLASFGYVVIATPSFGVASRSMTTDVAGANAQASDISFLLGFARTLPNADTSAVGVAGDSWGGMAGLFAAARDNRIAALVALDGSTRYYPGVPKLAGDVHPEHMTIPFMYFMQGDYSIEDRERFGNHELRDGPSVLSEWADGDLIVVHMLGMAHASFCSMWQRREDYWRAYGASPWQPGDYGREDAITGYAWVAKYTLKFLDAYLKHDSDALRFIKASPAQNGLPRHVMAVNFRAGTHVTRSYEDFRAEIGRRGFSHASQIYSAFQMEDPKFTLDEAAIADWADELIGDEHWAEGIALLNLNTKIHLRSSVASMQLGDAYRISGMKQRAVCSYQQALSRDPSNGFAKLKLDDLSAARDEGSRKVSPLQTTDIDCGVRQ
jgi:dienelactone hydrolase